MKWLKHQKLAGFTIIESLVAMVLILISFGIGMLSFNQLSDGDQIIQTARVAEMANNQLTNILQHKSLIDEEFELGSVTFLSEVFDKELQYQVSVSAKNNLGMTIYQLQTYIPKHEWNP